MSITLVYIIQNHLANLKTHLQHHIELISKWKTSTCIIIDESSNPDIKHYLSIHFPTIKYIKNSYIEGFVPSFEKAIRLCNTDYILLLDPSTHMHYINYENLKKILQSPTFFGACTAISNTTTTPATLNQLTWKMGRLLYQNNSQHTQNKHNASLFISNAIFFHTKRLKLLTPLNQSYFTPQYCIFDIFFHALKQGWTVHRFTDSIVTKTKNTHQYFSYHYESNDLKRDEFSFIWLNTLSFQLLIQHIIAILTILFGFKTKDLRVFLIQLIMGPFIIKKTTPFRWAMTTSKQILTPIK